jgi:hypothetical protein
MNTPANEWVEEKIEEFKTKFSYGGFGGLMPQHRDGGQILMTEVTDFIRMALDQHSAHLVERLEREVADLRSEHANTARHGNTPDDAYGRVENLLWSIKQEGK